jgi:hypothetical protein
MSVLVRGIARDWLMYLLKTRFSLPLDSRMTLTITGS